MEAHYNINPREHIEKIRKDKYWIGAGIPNPVSRDLRMAVTYLSAELYSKDVHFLMELIQNAEDNEYEEGVKPTLEFLVTCHDITKTGAPATLLIFNNEKGFSPSNIDSICAVGNSTKVGNRTKGYIGEKGIGFKSVFLLTSQPYIFSNGYQIRFHDKPCPECDIAYIVPEWVDQNPTVSDIEQIYGGLIPTTSIILPLKPDKVQSVKGQLSTLHPEMLLFLSKIRRLTVKEDNETNSGLLQSVSISSEKDFARKSSMDAESFTLHLAVDEGYYSKKAGVGETGCSYFMWRQRFPVKKENKVERRAEVDQWTITLAFPFGERLRRGMTSAGIYAFLPTEMVTNLPFIIQADFLLQSSREAILLDNVWNQGILDCVPVAFVSAFNSLVKTVEGAPSSSLASMFSFLPVKESSFTKLNVVRESIKKSILRENIMPSEDIISNQRFFYKPSEVGRIMPIFWSILYKAKKQGVKFHNLSSHGKYVLTSSFDKVEYEDVLKFLSVGFVDNHWYSNCIRSSNLVLGVDEDTYLDLLKFVTSKWSWFQNSNMLRVPLIKYVGADGELSLCSIGEVLASGGPILCRSRDSRHSAWLMSSSREFNPTFNLYFLPEETQEIIFKSELVQNWFSGKLGMQTLTLYEYANLLCTRVRSDSKASLAFAHFIYHCHSMGWLVQTEVQHLGSLMPLVDHYGTVHTDTSTRNKVLIPANGSKWIELLGSNPWTEDGYIELWEQYMASKTFGGKFTPEGALVTFLKQYDIATDIPHISPPNSALPCVEAPLTKKNVFLLLEWISLLNSGIITIPKNFLQSIKEGSWCRVLMGGSASYQPPSQSFLSCSSWDHILQKCSIIVDIPVIDEGYYDNKIDNYKDELKLIGVKSGCEDVCEFIGKNLTSLATESCFNDEQLIAILILIRYLRQNHISTDKLILRVKEGRLRTTCGDRSPVGCVLYDEGWKSASLVSDIPFLDGMFYGDGILNYKTELQVLGIVIGSHHLFQIVVKYLSPYNSLDNLKPETFIFLLKCIRHGGSSSRKVIDALQSECLQTVNKGYLSPAVCFLPDPGWGSFLHVFDCFPVIDIAFYGDTIFSYETELGHLGVVVSAAAAAKEFWYIFKQKAKAFCLTKEHVLSFLSCCKKLQTPELTSFKREILKQVGVVKWLRTRLGDYRHPASCILFGPDWEAVSRFTKLPFIDDGDTGYGLDIHEYKDELKMMKVVVDIEKNHQLVIDHISLPREMGRTDVFSLLGCVDKVLATEGFKKFPTSFIKEISKKWLKTKFGYRCPKESIMFGPKWENFLQRCDGPFIDEEYYGCSVDVYSRALKEIGVIFDNASGASLLANHLKLLSDTDSIKRVYRYLDHMGWKPAKGAASHVVWVPADSGLENAEGVWVSASECVLHDGYGIFGSRLTVLEEKGYDSELLSFFARAFKVRRNPSMDDYCQLWMQWENSDHKLSHSQCSSFWAYVVNNWNSKTASTLVQNLTKVPGLCHSGEILLVERNQVFIPDDLLLKHLFSNASSPPLFVWTPQPSHPLIPHSRLLEIFRSIGVKTISESAVKIESSVLPTSDLTLRPTQLDNVFLRRGLFMLVLGFLSSDNLGLEPHRRHEIVRSLIQVAAYETTDPITVCYSLPVFASSEGNVNVMASRMVCWDKEKSEFFAQKRDISSGAMEEGVIAYAKNFSQVISQGLLWDMEEHIPKLERLLTVGFCVGFDDEEIAYYMKAENLQLLMEDEEFLSSVLSSC